MATALSDWVLWNDRLPPEGVEVIVELAGPCGSTRLVGVFRGGRQIDVTKCLGNASEYVADWAGGDRPDASGRLMNWRPAMWKMA